MKFKIGDKVRCISSTGLKGYGWKECLEFTIDHFRPADSFCCAVYFPREGHGVYEEALELVEKNVKTLPKSFACKNTDDVLWKKYIAWLNKTYGEDFIGYSSIDYIYYGITISGSADNHTIEHFDHILSLEEWNEIVNGKQETKIEVMNKTIKKSDLKKIYDVACLTWQGKIEKLATRNPFGDDVELTQSEIDEMFKAADSTQTRVLEEVFGKQLKELDFRSDTIDFEIDGLSVFGGKNVPSREAFIGLPYEENMKSTFYLNPYYNWTLKGNRLTVTKK